MTTITEMYYLLTLYTLNIKCHRHKIKANDLYIKRQDLKKN